MLEIDNVSLQYGAAPVLKSVCCKAETGRITALLGRNGVGKTSLIRAIVGRHPISGGCILWQGRDISRLSSADRAAAGIAYVPQGREIFPLLTVRENLEVGFALLPRGKRRIPDAVFDLFPILSEMLGRRGGDLSGGQQQQLAIGRAMVTRPSLLVLDEPTEGIQPSIIAEIGRAIHWLRESEGLSVLLVEQYFDFARELAEAYYVMDRGEISRSGSGEEMRGRQGADLRAAISV